jgi:hypothetical protein
VVAEPLRAAVHQAVVSAGFRFVALDLAGVRFGAFTLALVEVSAPVALSRAVLVSEMAPRRSPPVLQVVPCQIRVW